MEGLLSTGPTPSSLSLLSWEHCRRHLQCSNPAHPSKIEGELGIHFFDNRIIVKNLSNIHWKQKYFCCRSQKMLLPRDMGLFVGA